MEFRILGPLDVVDGPRVVALPGAKHRALLAMLLLHANQVVSTERLTEALWDDEPPETAQKALQVYVSQLRKRLDSERLLTTAPGYLIRLEEDELDLTRFERLVREGVPREALELWRGPPPPPVAYADFAQSVIARLDELHLSCLEQRIDAHLAAGRSAELVGELEALVADHPLRERPREQLMLALYRSGRQAEALTTYRDGRHALVEELGIEPGRSLRELEQAILRQDPALDVTAPPDDTTVRKGAREPSARPLPTGTVTLFFADIEASTLLLQSLGAEYGAVLTRIRELVRAAVAEHGGSEADWAGDGVFLAFERARDALAAAAHVQRSLAAEPWPESAQVRMAIGVHTGEPICADDRYVGLDV